MEQQFGGFAPTHRGYGLSSGTEMVLQQLWLLPSLYWVRSIRKESQGQTSRAPLRWGATEMGLPQELGGGRDALACSPAFKNKWDLVRFAQSVGFLRRVSMELIWEVPYSKASGPL